MADKEDYEVGYKKPPKKNRFQKEQSGNSKGRPNGSRNVTTLFNAIIREKIQVKENGRSRRMTKLEAILRQLTNEALSGDHRARKEVMNLRQIFEKSEEAGSTTAPLDERDQETMQGILERLRQVDQIKAQTEEEQTEEKRTDEVKTDEAPMEEPIPTPEPPKEEP